MSLEPTDPTDPTDPKSVKAVLADGMSGTHWDKYCLTSLRGAKCLTELPALPFGSRT